MSAIQQYIINQNTLPRIYIYVFNLLVLDTGILIIISNNVLLNT